jgi:hypothetical protein
MQHPRQERKRGVPPIAGQAAVCKSGVQPRRISGLCRRQSGSYPETGFEEIRRTHASLPATLPRSGLLARNKLRIARDTDMMDDSRKKDRMYLQ